MRQSIDQRMRADDVLHPRNARLVMISVGAPSPFLPDRADLAAQTTRDLFDPQQLPPAWIGGQGTVP